MCNIFNLFRSRAGFLKLLFEEIINKYSGHIAQEVEANLKLMKFTNNLAEVLVHQAADLKQVRVLD